MSRVTLVTGGMGGLGEAICIKMADMGYQVATTDRKSTRLNSSHVSESRMPSSA